MGVHLANTPENWVYDTSRYSKKDVEGIFDVMSRRADKEDITPCYVLIKPRPGYERFVRFISGSVFKRVSGVKAREMLLKFKTATKS